MKIKAEIFWWGWTLDIGGLNLWLNGFLFFSFSRSKFFPFSTQNIWVWTLLFLGCKLETFSILWTIHWWWSDFLWAGEKKSNQMNQCLNFHPFSKDIAEVACHTPGRGGGLPPRLCHLPAAVTAFWRHRIDGCDKCLWKTWLNTGREMLIEGDPEEKPWHTKSVGVRDKVAMVRVLAALSTSLCSLWTVLTHHCAHRPSCFHQCRQAIWLAFSL